jgi:hypothetical protein
MELNNYEIKKETQTEKQKEIKKETENEAISFYDKLKLFITRNKIELGVLFVVIFTIFLSNDLTNNNNYLCNSKNLKLNKSSGGAASKQAVQQIATKTPSTHMSSSSYGSSGYGYGSSGYGYGSSGYGYGTPGSSSQMGYQIKSRLTNIGFSKLGSTIMNSSVLSKIFCYIGSFIKTALALGSIVLAVMLIPGIPVFGFMLLLFVILRDKMANIKAL